MTLLKALGYFSAEAWQSLVRSWKVSLVAVLTIGVSLFLTGGFLVTLRNLSTAVAGWQQEVAVVVYMPAEVNPTDVEDLRFVLDAPPWVSEVAEVSSAEAAERFRETFPRLTEVARAWEDELFPRSLEAALEPDRIDEAQFREWVEGLRIHPAALMVDADQDWLDQLATAVEVLRAGGLILGAAFLAAAALTTASILRLVAHLHREEIAIMRLVGATEFYIRGPFYIEGLLQGLGGAVLALLGIVVGVRAVPSSEDASLWSSLLFSESIHLQEVAVILVGGAVVGVAGAVLSLRREGSDSEAGE